MCQVLDPVYAFRKIDLCQFVEKIVVDSRDDLDEQIYLKGNERERERVLTFTGQHESSTALRADFY